MPIFSNSGTLRTKIKDMIRVSLIFIFNLYSLQSSAQLAKLFHEKKDRGYILYVSSNAVCPVSVSVDLDVTNLIFSEDQKKIFVIPPKSEKFKIGELTAAEGAQKIKLSYKYRSTLGDVTLAKEDKSLAYDLPFQKGKRFSVYQGYNGSFSHQGENAIDFTMPEGTEVVAAREGIVVELVQNNTESCPRQECEKYNNYITIMHSDGTFASYVHIKYNSSKFKLGDTMKKGDVIAYSGNTGWSSGPHLHFVCFLAGFGERNTIETKFRIEGGDRSVILKEANSYLRDY